MPNTPTRRGVIAAGSAATLAVAAIRTAAARLLATPSQTEGPFYPDTMPADTDYDLVRVAGRVRDAGGEILLLDGRVIDADGTPVANALVEIWQCDVHGRYHHTGDRRRGDSDDNFQGYGRTLTDAEGRYRFRTIRPVPYPGRTPHIHFKIHHPGGRVLTTQMYVAAEAARNVRDGIYRSLSADEQARVTVALDRPADRDRADWAGRFEVVLPWTRAG